MRTPGPARAVLQLDERVTSNPFGLFSTNARRAPSTGTISKRDDRMTDSPRRICAPNSRNPIWPAPARTGLLASSAPASTPKKTPAPGAYSARRAKPRPVDGRTPREAAPAAPTRTRCEGRSCTVPGERSGVSARGFRTGTGAVDVAVGEGIGRSSTGSATASSREPATAIIIARTSAVGSTISLQVGRSTGSSRSPAGRPDASFMVSVIVNPPLRSATTPSTNS